MAEIVPTITVQRAEQFKERLELIAKTTNRVHVDISDGLFTDMKLLSLAQVYVPEGIALDLHLMVQQPHDYLQTALALKPNLIIIHAEAEGDHAECAQDIRSMGVKAGIGYLTNSKPDSLVSNFDHALVFTGTLGHYGGHLHTPSLSKILEIKEFNPAIEVSVDGGVNLGNKQAVIEAGADVLYAGMGYEGMIS